METIAYDPAEIVLITKAPYVGLKLGQREIAPDIIAMAQTEGALNPEAAARLSEILKKANPKHLLPDGCEILENGEVSLDLVFYFRKEVPLVRYKGVLEREQCKYKFTYLLDGKCNHETTKSRVDYIIENMIYRWGILLESDDLCFGVETAKDRVVDPGCEIKFVDIVAEHSVEGDPDDPLYAPLLRFSEKYPAGQRIDPVIFTAEFLDLIAGE